MSANRFIGTTVLAILAGGAGVILERGFGASDIAIDYLNGAGIRLVAEANTGDPSASSQDQEKKVLYWVAPMDPNYRRDAPGKSPMGMDLNPVYEGEEPGGGDPSTVKISPAVINNLGVRTAGVVRRDISRIIETVGYISYDEEKISHIHLRTDGWIEDLSVKSVGERVKKGQRLFAVYSPTLVNAQSEYLQARQMSQQSLAEASWARMQALDISPGQAKRLAETGEVLQEVSFYAPQRGVVAELNVAEGMFVKPDTSVMTLADLSSVWLLADVFESQSSWVEVGQRAEVTLPYLPGELWEGVVEYIYPSLDPKTRSLKVRMKFGNPGEDLKPDMYADLRIHGQPKVGALTVPREALIRTGQSDRIVLALKDGRFKSVEVVRGIESGDDVEILEGVREGDEIVISAQFLIDSEASLMAGFQRMEDMPEVEESAAVEAFGTVIAVMREHRRISLSHDPIPELGWPSMTMEFGVLSDATLNEVSVGDSVRFSLAKDKGESYRVASLMTLADASDAPAVDAFGVGVINKVRTEERQVDLSHEPIAELGWPEMTMAFSVAPGVDLEFIKAGDQVRFGLAKDDTGMYRIESLMTLADASDSPAADAFGLGVVNMVMTDERQVDLTHEPIPELGWPTMTMAFSVSPEANLETIKAGDRIRFGLAKDDTGIYQIVVVEVLP